MMGGIGSCGKKPLLQHVAFDFETSIDKMVKVQNLSLNQAKFPALYAGDLIVLSEYE